MTKNKTRSRKITIVRTGRANIYTVRDLNSKNKMDISTFAKHMTEEEFHMISHINKDSGATGAFES